jgi:hypothetical protein
MSAQLTDEEIIQIAEFLQRTSEYKKAPAGNQPDEFLLGIMKAPIKDGPFSMKQPLELKELVKAPNSYRRRIDEQGVS